MVPGQLVDLNATGRVRVAGASLGVGAGASVGRGLNDAFAGAASGSFSIG
jgi:hypothetical protein